MNELSIKCSTSSYLVKNFLDKETLIEYLKESSDFIIYDSYFLDFFKTFKKSLSIESLEDNKSLTTVANICKNLKENGLTKNSNIVAIGGGIVQDLCTFSASVFLRGLNWRYVPTTLLGMVDSCIGGKSSINAAGVKNLVGNFYPPSEIFICKDFVSSLSRVEISSGLLEALKISYAMSINNYESMSFLIKSYIKEQNKDLLSKLIMDSLNNKKHFIEIDEFDKGCRKLLNFGHSWGHALEMATNNYFSHGIAVGIGMLAAMEFRKSIDQNLARDILDILNYGLESSLEILFSCKSFIEAFDSDKKHGKDIYNTISTINFGDLFDYPLEVYSLKKNEVNREFVLKTMIDTLNKLSKNIGINIKIIP